MSQKIQVRVLGSGTSTGVPVVGCDCEVCLSDDPKNKRMRSSILITHGSSLKHVVIDTTPDFRMQMLQAGVKRLSKVLYTHTHADHCHGFDDLRAFSFFQKDPITCYLQPQHRKDLCARFSYAFRENSSYPGVLPTTKLIDLEEKPFMLWPDVEVDPCFVPHGGTTSTGFRLGSFAYLTDFQFFPPEKKSRWRGKIHTMIASGIHYKNHPSHSNIPQTLELFDDLGVERGIITHTSHDVEYHRAMQALPVGREIAYDGMSFSLEI